MPKSQKLRNSRRDELSAAVASPASTATFPAPEHRHMDDGPAIAWYAVHTKAQAERLTADALHRKGFDIFLPMVIKVMVRSRQRQTVARPLFNRYLFVALDTRRPLFSEIRKTHGVDWLVENVGKPVPIPCRVIERLKEAEDEGLFDETKPQPKIKAKSDAQFKPGDKVRVTDGPFADIAGEVMAVPGDQRIHVLLNLFGKKTKFVVPAAKACLVA